MKYLVCCIACFFACAVGSLPAQNNVDQIGIVISALGGSALEMPNVTPTSNAWASVANAGQNANTDIDGWPTEDFRVLFLDQRPFNAWNNSCDDPDRYVADVSGLYTLSFKGQANLTSWSDAPIQILNKQYDPASNTTSANIFFPPGGGSNSGIVGNYAFFMLNFLQTEYDSTLAGVKDIQLYRPDYIHGTPQLFSIPFLNGLNPFSCIRYSVFTQTNNNNPPYPAHSLWQDRPLPTDIQFPKGAPWEYVIALANYVHKDVWINIPVAADSLYVVQLAQLFKNSLREDLNIYLEYSNEVWNGGDFTDYHYNYAAVLNSKEDADIRNSTPWDDRRRARRAARQVIKAGKIFEQVFGIEVAAQGRIRPVFAWQAAYLPWYDDVLSWVNTTYGPPNAFLYAISTAPYFSPSATVAETGSPEEIVTSMQVNSDQQVNQYIRYIAELAHQYGLKHLGYESGPGTNGGGNLTNLPNLITANRIPAMQNVVEHHYTENWFSSAANGNAPLGTNGLINYYGYTGTVSRYGCWGALEDLSLIDSTGVVYPPKYQALCALTGKCFKRPEVQIVSPGSLNVLPLNQPVQVQVEATDPDGSVQFVEFFAGTTWIGTDSVAPFSISWAPTDTGLQVILVKAVDNDGKYTFSEPLNLKIKQMALGTKSAETVLDKDLILYPNPAANGVYYLQIPGAPAEIQAQLYDLQGRLLQTLTAYELNNYKIELESLPVGAYLLQVNSREGFEGRVLLLKS